MLGGGPVQRHHAVRDALKEWLESIGVKADTEQEIPEWNQPDARAVLDIVYRDGASGRVCMDVSITDGAELARRGRPWRHVLERRERRKHRRYPGPGLRPFVIDVGGRWGREALAWLRQVLRRVPKDERGEAARNCRAGVAAALQTQCAVQFCTAHAEPPT